MIDLLFGIRGRIPRGKFWQAVLIYFLYFHAAAFVAAIAVAATGIIPSERTAGLLIVAVTAPLLASSVIVSRKRLHDRDKSGWWLFVFYFLPALPFVADVMLGLEPGSGTSIVMALVPLVIVAWVLFELGVGKGTRGANRFGPDPVAASGAAS